MGAPAVHKAFRAGGDQIEVLIDGGPLCVGPVWNHAEKRKIPGLYWVYFKRHGIRIGPFYAVMSQAENDMKKALKAFPGAFWDQDLNWYRRQTSFHDWIRINMGRPEDLIGGRWVSD